MGIRVVKEKTSYPFLLGQTVSLLKKLLQFQMVTVQLLREKRYVSKRNNPRGGIYCNTLLPYLLSITKPFYLTGSVYGTPPHKGKYQINALQASKTPQIKRLTLSVVSCKGKTF